VEGLIPDAEIRDMLGAMRARGGFISTRRNSDGSESPYELNISYFDAFRDPDPQRSQWHLPAFLLSQIMALSFRGIPAVYIHSLTATPNDILGVERTGLTRAINRRQWDRGELEGLMARHDSETGWVFRAYKRLLQIRRRQRAFHPDAAQRLLDVEDGLFALERTALDGSQRLVALFNCTASEKACSTAGLPAGIGDWKELIGESDVRREGERFFLPPYAACWFSSTARPR
jgi:sucrose phosphorylase